MVARFLSNAGTYLWLLGVCLSVIAALAWAVYDGLRTGKIRTPPWGRRISREEHPFWFWVFAATYVGGIGAILAALLEIVFDNLLTR